MLGCFLGVVFEKYCYLFLSHNLFRFLQNLLYSPSVSVTQPLSPPIFASLRSLWLTFLSFPPPTSSATLASSSVMVFALGPTSRISGHRTTAPPISLSYRQSSLELVFFEINYVPISLPGPRCLYFEIVNFLQTGKKARKLSKGALDKDHVPPKRLAKPDSGAYWSPSPNWACCYEGWT